MLEQEGRRLLGRHLGGVWARDTVPWVTHETRAMIVNIDSSPGPGIHWVAALDIGGQRYYNDPLGNHGKTQRAELEQLQPYEFAENDPEQTPEQKDCGVRTLVALMIGVHCGVECFLAL